MFVPMTSAGVKPNSRSAAELKEWMIPSLVDHDHRVGHGIEDRREVSRACMSVIRADRRLHTIALQLLSAPGHACPDQDECNGVDDFGNRKVRKVRDHEEAEHGAEAGGQQARSQAAETGSDQNRGDEEQIGRIPLQDRGERHPCNEGDGHRERSHPVPQHILPHQDPALDAAQRPGVAGFDGQMGKKCLHCRPVGDPRTSGYFLGTISEFLGLWRGGYQSPVNPKIVQPC